MMNAAAGTRVASRLDLFEDFRSQATSLGLVTRSASQSSLLALVLRSDEAFGLSPGDRVRFACPYGR